ncbi:MAG TPA: type II toxin-antitoxin system VapC family toxin [Planctomycetota bacterium]|nr:type II toxin-antitoxin system VapC family toxin [Planctomycetota bacterium]
MSGYLNDSTIWIQYSHGMREAADFLASARRLGRVACSVINMMEVIVGADDARHQRTLENMFRTFEVLPITEEDGWQAARLIKSKARSSGIGVADALIAATAMREGLTVATHNLKHFESIPGLKVIKPY